MMVLIAISIIHLCEAWVERVVIDLKNPYIPAYSRLNHEEHFRSAVLAFIYMLCATGVVIYYTHDMWLLPAIAINRRIFFDFGLIIFRDRPVGVYEGDDWWTKNVFIRIFGRKGRVIELLLELSVTAFCIVKTLTNG
jgi:hypothetical protein